MSDFVGRSGLDFPGLTGLAFLFAALGCRFANRQPVGRIADKYDIAKA